MTKRIIIRIAIIAASALIVAGVGLMIWMMTTEDERNNIEVKITEGRTESVSFENLSLVPGERCEYTLKLKSEHAEAYDLSLNFVEKEEKTLKNFARVKIISGETVVADELLANVFEDGYVINLPVDFTKKKNTELTVVYYLPEEVGNEAKNAEAVFELNITASKK